VIDFTTRVQIERPVADVYAFLVDCQNDVKWRSHLLEIERIGDDPPTYRQVMEAVGRRIESTYELYELDGECRIAYRSLSGPADVRASYQLEQAGDASTTLTFTGAMQTKGPLRLAERMLAPVIRHGGEHDLRKLKAYLEAGGS
jgi:uncharacterized membrane protein